MPHATKQVPGHDCNYRGYKNYDGTNGNTEWRALFRATQKLGATGRIFPAISFWRSQAAPCPETANHGRHFFSDFFLPPESRARVFHKPNCAATCSAGHEFIGTTGANQTGLAE